MTDQFKIDKGVPLPETAFGPKGGSKYPLRDMAVGDSFFIPATDRHDADRIRNNLLGCVRADRYRDKKFTTRVSAEGVRIWRIS